MPENPTLHKLLVLLVYLFVAGCKVTMVAPEGANIRSDSGRYDCLAGSSCDIEIESSSFEDSFYVEPLDGYEFVRWKKADRYLCGGQTYDCELDFRPLADSPEFQGVLEQQIQTYLEPVLTRVQTGKILVKAWNADGSRVNQQQFWDYVNFELAGWGMSDNFGVFTLGTLPATPQLSSWPDVISEGGEEAFSFAVPAGDRVYFTSMWKAEQIGTVFMRADNAGKGYPMVRGETTALELPYDFALGEFATLQRMLARYSPSPPLEAEFNQAELAMEAANTAGSARARALAAYDALAVIMPLKEKALIERSNEIISERGRRSDFDLNYEGFGSWCCEPYRSRYLAVRDAGFESVYTVVNWDVTLPQPDTYDFSLMDNQIQSARDLGYKVALGINRMPSYPAWAYELSFDELRQLSYEMAYTIVDRYGDTVDLYYPAGEYELEVRGLSKRQLAQLVRASMEGARAAGSSSPMGYYASASAYVGYQINVSAPGEYFSSLELLEYLKFRGLEFDHVAIQMQYGLIFAPIDLQRFAEVMQGYRKALQVPMYLGETAFSTQSEDYGRPANYYWREGLTQKGQYEWADGTLRALYAMPFVKGYYWVHVDPDDFDGDSEYLAALAGTGLFTESGEQKMSYDAFFDFLVELLN